jgi:hypothetical protein
VLRFIKNLLVGLAVLGGSLILLFFVLNQLKAHTPAPISSAAATLESWMQP